MEGKDRKERDEEMGETMRERGRSGKKKEGGREGRGRRGRGKGRKGAGGKEREGIV